MDEFDLLARDAPPPRHQLESDSEDSGEEQPVGSTRSQPALRAAELQWNGTTPTPASVTGKTVVVLEGPASDSYFSATVEPEAESVSSPGVVGRVLGGVGHVPQALVVPVDDQIVVQVRSSPSVTTLPEAAIGLAHELVDKLQPQSLVLLTSYNAGTYIKPWTDAREDDDGEFGPKVRVLTHGYAHKTLDAMHGVASLTVPNYLVGFGAALTSAALEHGSARVLVIAAPFLVPQPHGLYHGAGLARADAKWAGSAPRRVPRFGPEHRAAIVSALEAALPTSAAALAALAPWMLQEWKRVASGVPVTAHSSLAGDAPYVIGDGNLYL